MAPALRFSTRATHWDALARRFLLIHYSRYILPAGTRRHPCRDTERESRRARKAGALRSRSKPTKLLRAWPPRATSTADSNTSLPASGTLDKQRGARRSASSGGGAREGGSSVINSNAKAPRQAVRRSAASTTSPSGLHQSHSRHRGPPYSQSATTTPRKLGARTSGLRDSLMTKKRTTKKGSLAGIAEKAGGSTTVSVSVPTTPSSRGSGGAAGTRKVRAESRHATGRASFGHRATLESRTSRISTRTAANAHRRFSSEYSRLHQHVFRVGESVELKLIRPGRHDGSWVPAEIVELSHAGTYRVLVLPSKNARAAQVADILFSLVPASHVRSTRTKRRRSQTRKNHVSLYLSPALARQDGGYMAYTAASALADTKATTKKSRVSIEDAYAVQSESEDDDGAARTAAATTAPSTNRSPNSPLKKRRSYAELMRDAEGDDDPLLALMRVDEQLGADRMSTPRWNQEFQRALEADNHHDVFRVAADFVETAKMYGRVIIFEQFLPESEQTIKPFQAGGLAGGAKYRVRGMLVKLVQDPMISKREGRPFYLYGGAPGPNYEFASKSAAHDLRGASHLLRAGFAQLEEMGDGLRVPMQVVIDYHGYRAVCMPWIDLDGVVSGFREAKLYHHESHSDRKLGRRVGRLVTDAALQLHLAPHGTRWGKTLCVASDIEIHNGKDGRIYGLDLARLFPPEHPECVRHLPAGEQAIFFRLMRPELLQRRRREKEPRLSSDALSAFVKGAGDFEQQSRDVSDATTYLVQHVVGEWAREFEKTRISVDDKTHVSLSPLLHKSGINCRHMGLVRSLLTQEPHRSVLLVEIVARTLKNMLRGLLRTLVKRTGRHSDLIDIVVKFLNLTVGSADRRQPGSRKSKRNRQSRSELSKLSTPNVTLKGGASAVVTPFGFDHRSVDEYVFWERHVFPLLVERFGKVALQQRHKPDARKSGVEHQDEFAEDFELYDMVLPHMYRVVGYMLHMVGFRLTEPCEARFYKGMTTKKTAKVFTKFHMVDLAHVSLRVKQLSVLNLAKGRGLMDAAFAQLSVLTVSSSLVAKAIDAFKRIVDADPADEMANAEFNAACELHVLLDQANKKFGKHGGFLKSVNGGSEKKRCAIKWAGIVSEGNLKRTSRRLFVVTERCLWSFRPNSLSREMWQVELRRIGLVRFFESKKRFSLCVPSRDDAMIECGLAVRVGRLISDLIAKVRGTNLRYVQVFKDEKDIKFVDKSGITTCKRGLRDANAAAVRNTLAMFRIKGFLQIKGGSLRRRADFFGRVRGSILTGMPASMIVEQREAEESRENSSAETGALAEAKSVVALPHRSRTSPPSKDRKTRRRPSFTFLDNASKFNLESGLRKGSGDAEPSRGGAETTPIAATRALSAPGGGFRILNRSLKTEVVKKGWVEKIIKCEDRSNFKCWWCVAQLRSHIIRLRFFRQPSDDESLEDFILRPALPFLVKSETHQPNQLSVHQDGKTCLLKCASAEDAAEWIVTLRTTLSEQREVLVKEKQTTGVHQSGASSGVASAAGTPMHRASTGPKPGGKKHWFGFSKSEQLLAPIDLIGCTAEALGPTEIKLSWFGDEKDKKNVYKLGFETDGEASAWLTALNMAGSVANSSKKVDGRVFYTFDGPSMALIDEEEEQQDKRPRIVEMAEDI